MTFHWSLSDSKSPKVSRALLSFLINLYNAVVCIKSILPLISNSSSLFSRPLRIVPSMPTTIGITITFMFYGLFSFLARLKYLSIFCFLLIIITVIDSGSYFLLIFYWLIDFNIIRICLWVFYTSCLGNHIHCTFIFIFFVYLFLKCFCTQLYGFKYSYLIQIICTLLYDFKYSYLIQIICT